MTPFAPNPADVFALLRACPVYQATPLKPFDGLYDVPLWVKDETVRMRLGAFKGLGGPYAIARLAGERLTAESGVPVCVEQLTPDALASTTRDMTFVTASAGNHGVGVAAGAAVYGARARIHLSEQVPEAFASRLRDKGAEVVRSGATYADSVSAASADAERNGAVLLADGSWPGYTHPPSLIMEGYTVIAEEMRHAFEATGVWPTHVFLQAGVGGLACAVAHMIRENWAEQPEIFVVEPEAAPCLKDSSAAGKPVQVQGPDSNMGRLDCKEPSIVAFEALERADVHYVTVSDGEGAAASEAITAAGLATTPSGAAGFAGLRKLAASGHDVMARPLVIISEGQV